jgi:two-component system, NarL family, invasion response regulator UvrY
MMTTSNPRIRVIAVDDHPMIREGIRLTLQPHLDIEVICETSELSVALARAHEASVVILDLSLGEDSGLDALPLFKRAAPDTRVLVFSMMPAEIAAVAVFQAGANGYLLKGAAPSELVSAVRTVAAGRRFITTEVADLLAEHATRPTLLSPREVEILSLLSSGLRVSDVATHLHLSIKTVSTHKANMQRKLGVDSLAGLIRYAMEHRLTSSL